MIFYLFKPFWGIVAAGSQDIILVARVPEADVDVDDNVPHDAQDVVRHQPRDFSEVFGQQLPHFRAVAPEIGLKLHSPTKNICCLIFKQGVVVSRVKNAHIK